MMTPNVLRIISNASVVLIHDRSTSYLTLQCNFEIAVSSLSRINVKVSFQQISAMQRSFLTHLHREEI